MKGVTHLRFKRGWSQAEFARRAGMHPSTISLLERGRLNVYPRQLAKLARALERPEEAARDLMKDSDAGEHKPYRSPKSIRGPFKKNEDAPPFRELYPERPRPRKKTRWSG